MGPETQCQTFGHDIEEVSFLRGQWTAQAVLQTLTVEGEDKKTVLLRHRERNGPIKNATATGRRRTGHVETRI